MNLSNENIIHINKNGVQYLQFRRLLDYKEINHAYSLGIDVNYRSAKANQQPLSKEEKELCTISYKQLCNGIGETYEKIVKPNQSHTSNVQIVKEKVLKNSPDFNLSIYNEIDGLITNKKNIILSTTNADCILLMFYDPIKRVIANIHSGWKGTVQRISVKTVEKMIKEFNCNPEDIICCICPSIRKCHFEVDIDVKNIFENEFKDILEKEKQNKKMQDKIIEEKIIEKKWNIDTVLINKIILRKIGLKEENIIDSKICSVCNSNLIHSYRVEKQGYGIETALIELK